MAEDRIAALEARVERLEARLEPHGDWLAAPERPATAAQAGAATAASPATGSVPPPGASPSAPPAPLPREPIALEDFLGGRALAWVGGVAVVAGLAFLLTLAISRGWIGETGRTVLAGAISAALLVAGAWAREARVRNDATLAAAAAGAAGLFGTLVVAGSVYDLIPVSLALLGAAVTGAAATALAVRWRAQVMGWIGLMGALLAPAVLGALDGGGIVFLAIAYAATVAVLTWQRWTALGFAAFAVASLQWLAWTYDGSRPAAVIALTLSVFGLLTSAAAIGFEVRRRESRVRIEAIVLLALDAALLDAVGADLLRPAWLPLAAIAAVHLAAGLIRFPRVSRELSLVALGLGVILADVAFASLTSGLPLALGWAAAGIGFAALLRAAETPAERAFALAGLGGHFLAAVFHALAIDAPPLAHPHGFAAIAAVAAVGAAAATAARLAPRERIALDPLALAALGYATTLAFHGVALTLAFAAEGIALAALAWRGAEIARRLAGRRERAGEESGGALPRRDGSAGEEPGGAAARRDALAGGAALGFAGLALLHALLAEAPPLALHDGLRHPVAAAAALLAVAAAFAAARASMLAGAAVLYLASTEIVTAYHGQAGQTALSVLWAATGVALLLAGLVADEPRLRQASLALLALTATKVFVYDLASLDSLARVGSFVGLGLLLLGAGFAWQRVRPRALPDLREAGADAAPPALR